MEEKLYKIYYGDEEENYIRRYLKDNEIINGYLTEAKAFELFYDNMIMCNEYIKNNYDNLEELISGYNEEEDYYVDEYQVFIIDSQFDEDILKKITEKMSNTLYYDTKNELYITGITDLGTHRSYVETNIKVEEVKNE